MTDEEIRYYEEVIEMTAEIEKITEKMFPLITNMTTYFKVVQLEILLRIEYRKPNWYRDLPVSEIKEKYIRLSDEYMLTPMCKDMGDDCDCIDIGNLIFQCRPELTLNDKIFIRLLEECGELIKNTKISDELQIPEAMKSIQLEYDVFNPSKEDEEQIRKVMAKNREKHKKVKDKKEEDDKSSWWISKLAEELS